MYWLRRERLSLRESVARPDPRSRIRADIAATEATLAKLRRALATHYTDQEATS